MREGLERLSAGDESGRRELRKYWAGRTTLPCETIIYMNLPRRARVREGKCANETNSCSNATLFCHVSRLSKYSHWPASRAVNQNQYIGCFPQPSVLRNSRKYLGEKLGRIGFPFLVILPVAVAFVILVLGQRDA